MRKLLIFFMLFGFLSCKVGNKQLFKPYKGEQEYAFEVKEGYKEKRFEGVNEYQQEYWYADSMVFYLTTFRNSINYENIRKQGTYYERFNALNAGDTITLSGVDKKGFYWKDKLIQNGITIGFSNIHYDSLSRFENMILSFKKSK